MVFIIDDVEVMRKVENPPLLFTGVNDFQVDCLIDRPIINWLMTMEE